MTTLGERIRELRIEKGMSQTYLGKLIKVGKTTISNYETGYSSPDTETLSRLADALGTTSDYLLGRTSDRNLNSTVPNDDNLFPEEFTDPKEARAYVNKHQIFGSGGFDADKLDDEEILEFANALLEQMKMVSYKYRK